MPQGRKKVPFSGKAKREQMKAKKQQKIQSGKKVPFLQRYGADSDEEGGPSVQKVNYQPAKDIRSSANRYALQFFRETDQEIKAMKEKARHSLIKVPEAQLEIDTDQFFNVGLDFPKRPPWNFDLTKEELDAQENRYFTNYIKEIQSNFDLKELSYFELNLETWRQLWRVLEMSDVILFIVDIRYAAAMFPPSLYKYVTEDLKKDFILVLNKIDLAPVPIVVAWKHYFEQKFPKLKIVMFTSLPGYNLVGNRSDKGGLLVRRRKGRIRMAAEGTQQLFEVCNSLVGDKVDLNSWHTKIREEINSDYEEEEEVQIGNTHIVKNETEFFEYERFKNGVLTVGCLGQPNVGKSSLMNAIMGKKVVSVSRTPGHTKHFQTIFLTSNVKLCDCPGLVFPSKVPKPMQVLMGSFPIAQLREPYYTIRFLAERLDLVKMLRIEHPENDDTWSAMDICEGWALKRGFKTAKANRLDAYRAANNLLRMALDGKICLCLRPKGYNEKKDLWANHPDLEKVLWIQASTHLEDAKITVEIPSSDDQSNTHTDSDNDDNGDIERKSDDTSSEGDEIAVASNKFAALEDED